MGRTSHFYTTLSRRYSSIFSTIFILTSGTVDKRYSSSESERCPSDVSFTLYICRKWAILKFYFFFILTKLIPARKLSACKNYMYTCMGRHFLDFISCIGFITAEMIDYIIVIEKSLINVNINMNTQSLSNCNPGSSFCLPNHIIISVRMSNNMRSLTILQHAVHSTEACLQE